MWVCEKSVMTLPGVRHGFVKSLSWLCEEYVMALREVRLVGILPKEAKASLPK